MTATKRVRLSPEARRAQLIELGVEMLATRRLDELSVELIASAAGISRGLLFHYFASKQEFQVEVARAAAADMIERTAPDPSLPPTEALLSGVTAFVAYVEENPDNYTSLVRGAASGDADMRAIFDATRHAQAQRILDAMTALGVALSPVAHLAVHGWIAFVEECVIRWFDSPDRDVEGGVARAQLLQLLTNSLPAVAVTASEDDAASLTQVLGTAAH